MNISCKRGCFDFIQERKIISALVDLWPSMMIAFPLASVATSFAIATARRRASSNDLGRPLRLMRGSPLVNGFATVNSLYYCRLDRSMVVLFKNYPVYRFNGLMGFPKYFSRLHTLPKNESNLSWDVKVLETLSRVARTVPRYELNEIPRPLAYLLVCEPALAPPLPPPPLPFAIVSLHSLCITSASRQFYVTLQLCSLVFLSACLIIVTPCQASRAPILTVREEGH